MRTGIPRPQKLFMAWFGPKGVASMLFALFVLKSQVGDGGLIFDVAAIAIIASIVAHGLTDTVGARWMARRVGLETRSKTCRSLVRELDDQRNDDRLDDSRPGRSLRIVAWSEATLDTSNARRLAWRASAAFGGRSSTLEC